MYLRFDPRKKNLKYLITNSNMGWKTGCFANRILRWIGQGIVKVQMLSVDGWSDEAVLMVSSLKDENCILQIFTCKLWTLRCKKESRRVLPFFESVLKPRTVLGSIFSTALILVYGTVGVAQNCHSFCSVPPWLFGKSGGSMSFIGFYRWCFFFSRWDVRQVDVVPSHVQNLWQWWRWDPIGRGADFEGNNQGLDPTFMVGWSWAYLKTHHCIFGMKTSWLGQSSVKTMVGFIRGLRH